MGFGDAVASPGPYANNLHLAPDRKPYQHHITQFFTGRVLGTICAAAVMRVVVTITVKTCYKCSFRPLPPFCPPHLSSLHFPLHSLYALWGLLVIYLPLPLEAQWQP